jgi:hypothetical protein
MDDELINASDSISNTNTEDSKFFHQVKLGLFGTSASNLLRKVEPGKG